MPINTEGPVFQSFSRGKAIPEPTLACARDVTESLTATGNNAAPGMLLGKIQSGKTRTFITALAYAFDNQFDLAIVFTKGVKILTRQTVARLTAEFAEASDHDLVQVFDVMEMPENLPPALLAQKIVIVCKKEDDNIARLQALVGQTYPELSRRRAVIVDDEADFASVGYRRTGGAVVSAVIPTQIDQLRQVMTRAVVLQVTATPYALYLQPQLAPTHTGLTQPLRPTFTHLVPWGPGYVGGDVYFDRSRVPGSVESLFHVPVTASEMNVLRKEDPTLFRIEDCLDSASIDRFRQAIVSFLLGGFIRRWQTERTRAETEALPRFAFIVHSETAKAAHLWQVRLVEQIRDRLRNGGRDNPRFQELVQESWDDLRQSVELEGLPLPTFDEALSGVFDALGACMIHKVNSETQVAALINQQGELNLVAHYNVFVGGNILDRGITVPKVIGFFYGRRPRTSQQDTVLQHCRMYGYRPREDLTVTRFYTTPGIYASMQMIHQFDEALRLDLEARRAPQGVYFLRRDARGRLRATGPQRVLASNIETITPNSQRLLLPLGFDVREDQRGQAATAWIDGQLRRQFGGETDNGPFYGVVTPTVAGTILEHIKKSLDFATTDKWDAKGHGALLKYLARTLHADDGDGHVNLGVIRGGNQPRVRPDGRLQNYFVYPREVDEFRARLDGFPGLLLVRQQPGGGFRRQPFWWPLLLVPGGVAPHIFALS